MDDADIVEERFEELFDKDLKKYMRKQWGGSLSISDKRKAIRMKQDSIFQLKMLVHHNQYLESLDQEHLSKETCNKVRETQAKLKFNKKVKEDEYGLDWEIIEQMVVAGEFTKLKSARDTKETGDSAE